MFDEKNLILSNNEEKSDTFSPLDSQGIKFMSEGGVVKVYRGARLS